MQAGGLRALKNRWNENEESEKYHLPYCSKYGIRQRTRFVQPRDERDITFENKDISFDNKLS